VSSQFSWLTDRKKILPLLQRLIPNRDTTSLTISQVVYLCRHPHIPKRMFITNHAMRTMWLLRRGELHYLHFTGTHPVIGRSFPSLSNIVGLCFGSGLFVLDGDGKVYTGGARGTDFVDIPCPIVQIVGHGQPKHTAMALDSQGCVRVGAPFSSIIPDLPYVCSILDREVGEDNLMWFVDVDGGYHSYNVTYGTIQSGHIPAHRQEKIMTCKRVDDMNRYDTHDLRKDESNNLWATSNGGESLIFTDVEEFCSSGKYLGVITSDGTYVVDYLPLRDRPKELDQYTPEKIDFSFH
jgi:hypothetical protein